MGIDYYSCSNCEETYSDARYDVLCECGHRWCSDFCAEQDGFDIPEYEGRYEDHDNRTCKFCRGEDFEDHQLLHHAQELLGVSREQLIKSYKGGSLSGFNE